MLKNLIGELRIMKELKIMPNFSALSRKYGIDRHTIRKYYDVDGIPLHKSRKKESVWEPYYEEVVELLDRPGITKNAIYMYLVNKYPHMYEYTYSGFKSFTLRKGMIIKPNTTPHVLFETAPGVQIQTDWKESLKMPLTTGEVINFNVYSATLGYSREHVFIYSPTKTEDDFVRCTIEVFRRLGGTTDELVTDNMSAIVTIQGRNRIIHPRVKQFMEDINVKLKLCKAKSPQTKGKDENSNKFLSWLIPYQGKLNNEMELIHIIENVITSQANAQINTGTGLAPHVLFKKEKEYLKPLNNKVLLDSYINNRTIVNAVPATLLVYFEGNRYSVPKELIGQKVELQKISNKLYIYHKKELIAIHTISQQKINYDEKHYKDALSVTLRKHQELDIDEMAQKNLNQLSKLGGNNSEY